MSYVPQYGSQVATAGTTDGTVVPPAWDTQRSNAQTAFNNAMAGLNARHQSLLDQYGFSYTTGPDGSVHIGQLDPSKQFGAIQQLIEGQGHQLLQDRTAEMSRGIGMGGLAAQQAGALRVGDSAARANQAAGLQDQTQQLAQAGSGASDQLNATLAAIDQAQAEWNLTNQINNPPQPTPVPPGPTGVPGYVKAGFRSPTTYLHPGAKTIPGL